MKLTAETRITASRETVWRFSQTPALHVRWYLRFSDIEYLPRESTSEPQRFRYATRIGFGRSLGGWKEAPAQVRAAEGSHAWTLGLEDMRLVRATEVAPIDYLWRLGRTENIRPS